MWKSRLYAFIFRRILGPYLTERSQAKLHQSLNLSLRQGILELNDIEFQGEAVEQKFHIHFMKLEKILIGRMKVKLELIYENQEGEIVSSYEEGNARLVANITLDGLHVVVRPSANAKQNGDKGTDSKEDSMHGKDTGDSMTSMNQAEYVVDSSFSSSRLSIKSYLQAALDSLKLSLEINDFTVRVEDGGASVIRFIECNVASILSKDVHTISRDSKVLEANEDLIVKTSCQKKISMDTITVTCGESYDHSEHLNCNDMEEIVRMDRIAQITFMDLEKGGKVVGKDLDVSLEDPDISIRTSFVSLETMMSIVDRFCFCMSSGDDPNSMNHSNVESVREPSDGECSSATDKRAVEEARGESTHIQGTPSRADEQYGENTGLLANIMQDEGNGQYMDTVGRLRDQLASRVLDMNVSDEDVDQNNIQSNDIYQDVQEILNSDEDEDFEHYRNALEESVENSDRFLYEKRTGDSQTRSNSKRMRVYVRKVALQMFLFDGTSSEVSLDHDRTSSDCITVIAEKLEWNLNNCHAHQNFSLNLYKFSIDYVGGGPNVNERDNDESMPILSFHDQMTDTLNDTLIDPVISIHFETGKCDGETSLYSDLRVAVEPFTFYYRELALSKVADRLKRITENSRTDACDSQNRIASSTADPMNLNCHFFCVYAMFVVPLSITVDDETTWDNKKLPRIFERSGYDVSPCPILNGPAMAMEVTNFGVKYERGESCLGLNADYQDDLRIGVSFQNAIISLASPVFMCENKSWQHKFIRKLDLIAIESEDAIDPNAIVKVEFSQSCVREAESSKQSKARFLFPKVQPLALVKASQQLDEFADYDETSSQPQHKSAKVRQSVRASDPQKAMLDEIDDCESVLSVYIPSMAMDLSTVEIDVLSEMLSSLKCRKGSSQAKNDVVSANQEQVASTSFFIWCNQSSMSIHYICDDSCSTKNVNHLLIIDDFKCFCFQQQHKLRSIRMLCDDITLFEGVERNAMSSTKNIMNVNGVKDMCEHLRKRRAENYNMVSAVFFRSKLSQPLSPKTPAVLLDVLINGDENHVERSIHLSLYDMTYRYDCQSQWIEKLRGLIPGNAEEDESGISENMSNDLSILNNVFITFSDCNIDFTSPAHFITCSRTILRIGEVRITSSINSPVGALSVFKLAMADASIHVVNERINHDIENMKLSSARIVFGAENRNKKAPHDLPNTFHNSVSRLAFVRVATLDCLDCTITLNSEIYVNDPVTDDNPSEYEAAISMGCISIYACKDTFLCFTETINELITHLTMPTVRELEEKRRVYLDRKQQHIQTNDDLSQESSSYNINSLDETEESFMLQKPTSLGEVIDNGLFASDILEYEEDSKGDREIIDDFFCSNRHSTVNDLTHGTSSINDLETDNFDSWTEVYHSWANDGSIPEGEEQASRWYVQEPDSNLTSSTIIPMGTRVVVDAGSRSTRPHVFTRHVPIEPKMNPLRKGDMGASNFAGTSNTPQVRLRLLIMDMSLNCRFFDGYDWDDKHNISSAMNDLLVNETLFSPRVKHQPGTSSSSFTRCRHSQRYFQFSFSGLKLRLDSFVESTDHSLTSCMEMTLNDLSLLETISCRSPVKLLGEWVNEEHPRDCNDGLLMMKMVSMLPAEQFSSDGQLMGNENRVTIEFLPMRFFIHQTALRFIREFFRTQDMDTTGHDDQKLMINPPELFFPVVKVKSFNIKVDYKPKEIDTTALKDGSLVELLNVLPLEDMVLRLSEVEMRNLTGWGSIISELACNWLQDISSTQMHKFLTRTTPLHPFASVGDGMKQFFMIPIEEYKQKGDVKKGLRRGTKKFANILAYESLSVGAKVSGFAARRLGAGPRRHNSHNVSSSNSITTSESISCPSPLLRGLKEANTKMIIIPYREYQQHGTKGVVKSVVRGLPVAVCAPLSGAAEAVSHGLYGVRDHLRPDLREEEEVSKRLHYHNV